MEVDGKSHEDERGRRVSEETEAVLKLQQRLAKLRAAAQELRARHWLRLSRKLLRTSDKRALHAVLEERQQQLRQQTQLLEYRLQAQGLEGLERLQAQLEDLQLGGSQWRLRLQETAQEISRQGRRLSRAEQLCPAERELLRLQAELERAKASAQAADAQRRELQQLRAEVAALQAEADAPSGAASGPKVVNPPASSASPKPKAKAKGPPPPKAKPKPKAPPLAQRQALPPRSNGLVHINWQRKASHEADVFEAEDDFLRPMAALSGQPIDATRLRQQTVWEGEAPSMLTEAQLQYFFGARSRAPPSSGSRSNPSSGSSTPAGARAKAAPVFSMIKQRLLDDRTIRSAGLFLARYRMRRHRPSNPKALVEEIFKAFLQCTIVKDDHGLENLREAVEGYVEGGRPIASFVQAQGPEALGNCEPEAEHRLLHEMSTIPGINERMRCFRIQSSWDKEAAKCKNDLEVLQSGLKVLTTRKDVLRKFFSQALKLGNELNQEAGGPLAPFGFRLSCLETLAHTKSPWRPKISLLHLVLGLMSAEEVERLAGLQHLDPIRAHGLLGKSSGVQERCRDLVTSMAKLRQTAQQVPQKRSADKVPLKEDTFHEYLDQFLESRRGKAIALAEFCCEVFQGYKDLAIFLGEPAYFYPPPVTTENMEDMFRFFHNFSEVLLRTKQDVASLRLREELQAAISGGPEAAARVAEEVAMASGMPHLRRRLLPEPVTKADAVLMTPPGSPKVRGVASPCRDRGRASPNVSAVLAVQRLKKTATPEGDAQSDVSDWEPNSEPRPGAEHRADAEANTAAAAPQPAPAPAMRQPRQTAPPVLAVRKRRLALPRERPMPTTPSSSTASSPKYWLDSPRDSSRSRLQDSSPERTACITLPLPATPRGRSLPSRACTAGESSSSLSLPGPDRRQSMRLSLSMVANRLECAALSRFESASEAGEGGDSRSRASDDSPVWVSCSSSPCQRSVDTSSTDSTWETARSCWTQPIGPEANASMTAELKVHRRSHSRELSTPLAKTARHGFGLSPVAEPGETPYKESASRGPTSVRSETSAGGKTSPPTARRLQFGRSPRK